MRLNTAAALLFAVCVLAVGYFLPAKANLNNVDPYAARGWYEVVCSDHECVRYNPRSGQTWILACPGPAMLSCEWEPVEERE